MDLQTLMQLTNEVVKDSRIGISYRKLVKMGIPELNPMTEVELFRLKDEIMDKMVARDAKVEQEGRSRSADEQESQDACNKVLDVIEHHINYRQAEGITVVKIPKGLDDFRVAKTGSSQSVQTPSATDKVDYRSICVGNRAAPLSGANIDPDKFLTNIANGIVEERTMVVGSGPLGGFDVPEIWWSSIFNRAVEKMIVLPNCQVYPFPDAGNVLHIPAWDDFNHQEGLAGGLNAPWIGENTTSTAQDARLRMVTMILRKMLLSIDLSRESAEDGISLEAQISPLLRTAVAYQMDYAFLRGTGINQPSGALNSASRVTVNRDTANSVKYADVVALYSKMHPAGYDTACWVASQSVLPQLLTLVDAGSHNIWVPSGSGSISAPAPSTLFGKPIYFTEKTPSLGSEGDLSFIDFSQYCVAIKRGAIVERSNAPQWSKDLISFRIIVRCDGSPLWDKPLTLKDGTEVSWCVSLK